MSACCKASEYIRAAVVASLAALGGCAAAPQSHTNITTGTQFAVTGNQSNLYTDLQGILWRLPGNGGRAVALSISADDLRLPALSPDGSRLVMQSFARGHWDIVLTDTDGNLLRRLTESPFDDREPAWSADGRSVLFTSDRSGNEDIWSVDLTSGALTQLTNDQANDYGPAATADGFLFVSERDRGPALYGHMAGAVTLLAKTPAGRLHAPRISPDGRYIAYVQAIERSGFPGVAVNALTLLDVQTDKVHSLSADGSDVFAMPPHWLDADTLLYTADGRIQRLDLTPDELADSRLRPLNFSAAIPLRQDTYERRTPLAFTQDPQPMLGIVDPVMLTNDRIAFTALGDLWLLDANGELEQLTDDAFVERDVNRGPDRNTLVYISDRGGSMQIWQLDLGSGQSMALTEKANGPRYPTFSPGGNQLAYQQVGPIGTQDFTVRLLDPATGKSRKLRSSPKIWPGRMAWSTDGNYLTVAELHRTGIASDGRNRLVRINVANDSADVIELPAGITPDAGPVASPNGRQLALLIDGKLHRLPLTADGKAAGEPELVLDALAESPAWSADGNSLLLLGPDGQIVVDLAHGKKTERNPAQRWQPALNDQPQIIHAGRLWDGVSDTYIENVDLRIDGARIKAIAPHSLHPPGMTVIDASEQTVLPGLIDHHVHFEPHKGEWVGRALLAFGVTTVVEPGGLPYESREHFESWLSGRRAGPRLVYAGPQLDGERRTFYFASHITNTTRLQRELERGERLGYGLLKTYRRMRPDLQAQTVELAHARGLPITAHAATRNIGVGGDRTEHLRGSSRTTSSPKQSDLLKSYADIDSLYMRPGAAVTPTLINQGGFFDFVLDAEGNPNGSLDTIAQYNALYTPAYRNNLAGFARMTSRNIDLIRAGLANAGASLDRLDAAGVQIVAGTDSPIFPYGLALIIELQNYVDAGLRPAAALRTAMPWALQMRSVGWNPASSRTSSSSPAIRSPTSRISSPSRV
jgi:Tol biopolymer transport system component